MLGKSQQLNSEIAQTVFRQAPPGWATATVKVKMISSHAELQPRYTPQGGDKPLSFTPNREVYALFEQLRESMYEDVGSAWYVAILSLTAQGDFRFQYDYDDLSQFQLKPSAATIAADLQRFPRSKAPDA